MEYFCENEKATALEGTLRNLLFLLFAVLMGSCGENKADPVRATEAHSTPEAATPKPPELSYRFFPDAPSAVGALISEHHPRVIGFGEYHQQLHTERIRSTLSRFTAEVLPALAPRTSDLILETWLSEGGCGETEKAVVKEVDKVINRPKAAEDESLAMLKRAMSLGVKPHVLQMSCADYDRVHISDGGLDYVAMLELVGQRLGDEVNKLVEKPEAEGEKMIAVFCGAVHNDSNPEEDFASFSFGPRAREAAGEYLEIDVYVPEFIEGSNIASSEPWYEQVMSRADPNKVSLTQVSKNSYILLLKKGVLAADEDDGADGVGDHVDGPGAGGGVPGGNAGVGAVGGRD